MDGPVTTPTPLAPSTHENAAPNSLASASSENESLRLCLALQQEELAASMAQAQQNGSDARPSAADGAGSASADGGEADQLDEETRATLELARRLQEEERLYLAEQQAAHERLAGEAEDEDSLALAIRLQQEDDEQALRDALGLQGGEGDDDDPGSPSQYSYEQLMRLGETVGEVSRGASGDQIESLRTLTVAEAQAEGSGVILGEQCSICRMEFEPDDTLRVLSCGHAEHVECIDQWLRVNKACCICQKDIVIGGGGGGVCAERCQEAEMESSTTRRRSSPRHHLPLRHR